MTIDRAVRIVWLLSLTVVLGACGAGAGTDSSGGDDGGQSVPRPDSTNGPAGSEVALEQAVTAAFEAFVTADDASWFAHLSNTCQTDLGFAAVASHLDGRRFAVDLANIDLGALRPGAVSIAGFDGQSASVSLAVEGTDESFRESISHPWIFEVDTWRMADCSDITPSANDLSTAGASPDTPIEHGFIADLEGWLITLSWMNLDDEATVLELGGVAAAPGNHLVTANVSMTYNGADTGLTYGEALSFAVVSGGAGESTYDVSCEVADYSMSGNASVPLQPGESTHGIICREVPEDALADLLLRVTHAGTGGQRWFTLSKG